MVQFLPARGFGAGLTETLPEAFQDALGKYFEQQQKGKLATQQSQLQIARDKAKILEQEAAKEREMERFSKLLGISPSIDSKKMDALSSPTISEKIPTTNISEIKEKAPEESSQLWERLDPNQKTMFALRFPSAAKQMQEDFEFRSKQKKEREEIEREPLKKGVETFFTKLQEDSEKLPGLELSLESMLDAVKSGQVDPFSSAHIGEIASAFGVPKELTKILETPGSKEFKSARKQFLSSTLKEAFRGATTGKEIELAESLLAELGIRPEANLAAIFLLQSDLMLRKEKQRLAEEASAKGISNYKIPSYINKQLEPFRKQMHKEYMDSIKELRKRTGLR